MADFKLHTSGGSCAIRAAVIEMNRNVIGWVSPGVADLLRP